MNRIKKIFEGVLSLDQSTAFQYTAKPIDKKVVGIIQTGTVETSLAFSNGTKLVYENLQAFQNSSIAPDKRIIKLDEQLNCCIIKGSVKAVSAVRGQKVQTSIYLIIQQ